MKTLIVPATLIFLAIGWMGWALSTTVSLVL